MKRKRLFILGGYCLGVLLTVCGIALSAVNQTASANDDDGKVVPIALCTINIPDGSFTAVWSYQNTTHHEIKIPVGSRNKLSPSSKNGSQPVHFEPGTVNDAFRTNFGEDDVVRWTLTGPDGKTRTAEASDSTVRCAVLTQTPGSGTASPSAAASQAAASQSATISGTAPSETVTATTTPTLQGSLTPSAVASTTPSASGTAQGTTTPTTTQTPTGTVTAVTATSTLLASVTPTQTSTSIVGSGLTVTPSPSTTQSASSTPTPTLSSYPVPTFPSVTSTPFLLPVSGADQAGTAAASNLASRLLIDGGLVLLGLVGVLHALISRSSQKPRE